VIFKYSSGAIGTRLRYGLASVIALLVAFGVIAVAERPAQADTTYPYNDCHAFPMDFGDYCVEWTGGYPNGYVRARVQTFPAKASVGLQECTTGSCQPGQFGVPVWTLVLAAYNYPNPPVTPGRRVGKYGAYRACSQSVPGGVWSCMYYSTYLGD
jgi:hypothetical protein